MKYRFNFLLSLVAMLLMGITTVMAQSSEVYGVLTSGTEAGIYKYTISPEGISDIECVCPISLNTEQNNEDRISGGCLVGDRYYYSMFVMTSKGYQSNGIYYYDLEEETTVQVVSWDYKDQGPSCASWMYDFQNEVMYAGNGFQGGGTQLLTVDLTTGALNPVVTFNITEQPEWAVNPQTYATSIISMCMTYDGTMYGVGYWGGLYKIDPTTGDCELIGYMKDACPNPSNGQVAFQYGGACDLVYDNDNGKMYLFMYQYPPTQYVPAGYGGIGSGYALFEVDPETADVTYIEDTEGKHFNGNSVIFSVAEASAPQAPQNLTATRGENGALSVTLEWDNPAKTYARGADLEELDYVVVLRNGEEVYRIENPEIGGHVTWTDTEIAERGNYSYRISGYNSMGQGDRASVTLYVGPGDPMAVSTLLVAPDGPNAKITWVAPTEGKYKSWIDVNDLTYDVTRQPGDVKVAEGIAETEFIDETVPAIGFYTYEVVAHAGGYSSETVTSASTMVGPAITLPATIGFVDQNQFNLWKVYDLNGNNSMFMYSQYWPLYRPCAYVIYNYDNLAAADAIISPYLQMEAGKHYKMTFDATFNTKKVPEKLDIVFGTGVEIEQLGVIEEFHLTPTADKQKYSLRANLPVVEKDSTYHVGFFLHSDEAINYGVYLENVKVEEDTDGYIAGTVTNEAGEAIEGALLLINGGQFNATTDAEGKYTLKYLPAGEYNVDISALGYESQTISTTVESLETTEMNVTMTALPTYTVSGTVKDIAGDVIAGAEVQISGYKAYSATTDEQGEFTIGDVIKSDNYYIYITKNKYMPYGQALQVNEDLTLDIQMDDNTKAPSFVKATESDDQQSVFVEWGKPLNDARWVRFDDGAASTYVGVANDYERNIGGSNAVFGVIDRTPSTVQGVSFYLGSTAQVSTHYSVYLRIFDLDENGEPTTTKLYENTYVTAQDDAWTTYYLPAPVEAPNGYYIAISHGTWAGIGIDGGDGGDAANYPFKPMTSCFSGNYQTEPFLYLDNQANEAFHHNFMMRPYAAPYEVDEDHPAKTQFCYKNTKQNVEMLQLAEGNIGEETAEWVEPAECSHKGINKTVQERVRYDVYRFNTQDEADPTKWVKLAEQTQELSLTDTDWASLDAGAYYYGVKAVYTGDKESQLVKADSIGHNMTATVTFRLTTNTEENEAFGARVFMINGGGRHVYEGIAGDDGVVVLENVWKTGYDVTISLDGFETQTGHYEFLEDDEFDYDITLNEHQVQPYNLIVEDIDGQPTQKNFIWNYPDYFFDGFEDHPDFAVNSPGVIGWNYIDGDGAETGGPIGYDWPNLYQPMAYQVFNPYSDQAVSSEGTRITSLWYGMTPRSGQRMLTDFAAYAVPNDDWLITPALHFQEDFVFKFWAKCIDYNYLETFNVLYSTTDMEPESFIPLKENVTAYSYYQQTTVDVPKEAKYVAIQCVSDQKRVFCIDDIEFGLPGAMAAKTNYLAPLRAPRRMPALEGAYEVYLDGEKVTDTDETNYLFENLRNGTHTAGVIASYTSGKTEMSTIDFVVDAPTGLASVKGEMRVSLDGRRLNIKGEYTNVMVYANDGKMVHINRVADGLYSLNGLPAGVYVVSVKTANGVKSMKATLK